LTLSPNVPRKVLITEALDGIETYRAVAMSTLEALGIRCKQERPAPDFVEQASRGLLDAVCS
jgi:hypothetical protein